VNKHYVTHWRHGSLLSSQFVEIWQYCWYILESIILYSMETILRVNSSKLLLASSTITMQISWLQGTIIWLHIQVRVFYFPPILWRFENIGVVWSIILYSEERVLSVEASSLIEQSSTTTKHTSWLEITSIWLHIGDMVAYYHPSLWRFDNIVGIFWRVLYYTPWRPF
jgi:hypothetical protein